MRTRQIVFLTVLIGCLLLTQLSRPAAAGVTRRANTAWHFVEIETAVHPVTSETDSDEPNERRWYISNVVVQPDNVPTYSLVKQKIIPYFSSTVMDPAEKCGIAIDFGEQDVRLNGESSFANYATREEAEEERTKAIAYRKDQSGNIYSFELVYGPAKGEETSKPKLIYRDTEQPNYEK